ncbi:MAG: helix-turn-helix domain-containing protein [Desulfobulbus sp.]|jgi:cytoskeletal protein RodZ
MHEKKAGGDRIAAPYDKQDGYAEQPPRVGLLLQTAREKQGLSVQAVSQQTRIARTILRAIEKEDYAQLPPDTFTRGLIVLYAEQLGFDGPQTADRFFAERGTDSASSCSPNWISRSQETNLLTEPPRISSATLAAGLLGLIIVSFALFSVAFSWNPLSVFTDKFTHADTSTDAPFHPANPATKNGTAQQTVLLHATFLADCTLEATIDQQPTQTMTFRKGSTMHWEAGKRLQVVFAQPDCATLQVNGAPYPFPPAVDGRCSLLLAVPSPP